MSLIGPDSPGKPSSASSLCDSDLACSLRILGMCFHTLSCAAIHTWKQLPTDQAAPPLIISPSLQCCGLLASLTKRNLKKAKSKNLFCWRGCVCHFQLNCDTSFFLHLIDFLLSPVHINPSTSSAHL